MCRFELLGTILLLYYDLADWFAGKKKSQYEESSYSIGSSEFANCKKDLILSQDAPRNTPLPLGASFSAPHCRSRILILHPLPLRKVPPLLHRPSKRSSLQAPRAYKYYLFEALFEYLPSCRYIYKLRTSCKFPTQSA